MLDVLNEVIRVLSGKSGSSFAEMV